MKKTKMPSASITAKRREQLSAARKKLREKVKRGAKEVAKNLFSDAEAAKRISWLEIIFIPLPIALLNDVVDIFEITIIGKLGTILVDIITAALLFIWFWLRVRQQPSKKLFRTSITFFAEIIPVLGLLPMWTLLVLAVKVRWVRAIITLPEKLLML